MEPMSPDEIREQFRGMARGGKPSAESLEIDDMAVGEGLKFPCRWTHYINACAGARGFYGRAQRQEYTLQIRCVDKTLYVLKRNDTR